MERARSFLKELGYAVEKLPMSADALYGMVWIVERAEHKGTKVLKIFGLTLVKLNCLLIAKYIGGEKGAPQREIGKRLLIDPGNVTRVLDGLENSGLVKRAAGPDRRSHRIRITPKGDTLLSKAWPAYTTAVHVFTSGLRESDQCRLLAILCRWKEALRG